MSTSLLYHAFGIRGYEYTRTDYQDGHTIFTIHQEPKTCRCPACGAREVQPRGHVRGQDRARRALELEPRDVLAVADRADHGVKLAARDVCFRADLLHLAHHRLDLVGRGGLFHDDHHLDLILLPTVGDSLRRARACARKQASER